MVCLLTSCWRKACCSWLLLAIISVACDSFSYHTAGRIYNRQNRVAGFPRTYRPLHFIPSLRNREQSSCCSSPSCRRLKSQAQRTSETIDQLTEKVVDINALKGLDQCTSSTQAKRLLDNVLGGDNNPHDGDDVTVTSPFRYNSIRIPSGASSRPISDGDLAIQTRMVNKRYKNIMELIELSGDRDIDRASAALFAVMVGSTSTALVANENLPGPEIIRFLIVWIFSFMPLAFVGYGISDVEKLQSLLVTIQREVFPIYRKRMIQHEAGHFLIGHLLGYPVRKYATNAVKNAVEFFPLSDADIRNDYASQLGFDAAARRGNYNENSNRNDDGRFDAMDSNVPYFSKDGRGGDFVEQRSVFRKEDNLDDKDGDGKRSKPDESFSKIPSLNAQYEPSKVWPYRGFNDEELDQLCAISVAGVCSEILAFGNAEGGVADLSQLQQIFASSQLELTQRERDNRIRFALGFTITLLRQHLGALDALAEVMERGGSVSECVLAIESCKDVSGQNALLGGNYELERRRKFREDERGIAAWIEKVFLGASKNADLEEDRYTEGKGGGYIKESFRLTGDDPIYAAVGVSLAFLVYAFSGGITLH